MINLGIAGAAGRMGKTIVQAATDRTDMTVSAALEQRDSPALGLDAGGVAGIGELGVGIQASIDAAEFDILIDFTSIEATLAHLKHCRKHGRKMVIGTTGFDERQRDEIQQASADIALVMAPNMSVGVNLCFHLLETAAGVLGDSVDVEIIEAHHRHKVDAPSGTAVRMGEIVAAALERDLSTAAVYGRQGVGEPRSRETIGFSTIRGGDIVGDHTVMFAADGERVEITHRAASRMTFAAGALRAAAWLADKDRGLFDMQDVLGLK